MQTFLPFPDFLKSAQVLDNDRLGKQRSEAKQLVMIITGQTSHWKRPDAWRNHPAARMWRGHAHVLCQYALVICEEWARRDMEENCAPWFQKQLSELKQTGDPPWLGNNEVHASHRSNLLRKDPEHYAKFGWSEGPDLPYCWPV